eukprot:TRINITY_DN5988_c0_g1_i1.p1 TRINITY_DN5988_c0_g1~~TRINITY_DN5988_c0_g1_i1.p1  ORF type:complete len:148 (-),score=34.41 TRINITY_DN5988_c0_g1_i1:321-764(-)
MSARLAVSPISKLNCNTSGLKAKPITSFPIVRNNWKVQPQFTPVVTTQLRRFCQNLVPHPPSFNPVQVAEEIRDGGDPELEKEKLSAQNNKNEASASTNDVEARIQQGLDSEVRKKLSGGRRPVSLGLRASPTRSSEEPRSSRTSSS